MVAQASRRASVRPSSRRSTEHGARTRVMADMASVSASSVRLHGNTVVRCAASQPRQAVVGSGWHCRDEWLYCNAGRERPGTYLDGRPKLVEHRGCLNARLWVIFANTTPDLGFGCLFRW